jgi:hypothetical protein
MMASSSSPKRAIDLRHLVCRGALARLATERYFPNHIVQHVTQVLRSQSNGLLDRALFRHPQTLGDNVKLSQNPFVDARSEKTIPRRRAIHHCWVDDRWRRLRRVC